MESILHKLILITLCLGLLISGGLLVGNASSESEEPTIFEDNTPSQNISENIIEENSISEETSSISETSSEESKEDEQPSIEEDTSINEEELAEETNDTAQENQEGGDETALQQEKSGIAISPAALIPVKISNTIVINHSIYETTTKITGYINKDLLTIDLGLIKISPGEILAALLAHEISLSVNDQVLQSIQFSSDHTFEFNLSEPLPAGSVISFGVPILDLLGLVSLDLEDTVVLVEIDPSPLDFQTVPSNIVFEQTTTEYIADKLIYRQSPNPLSISILNPGNKTWSLSVSAQSALTTADASHTLPNALVFKQGTSALLPISPDSLRVATSNTSTKDPTNLDLDVINWNSDEGLLLQLNPFYTLENTEYSTTVNWTLTNGIQ